MGGNTREMIDSDLFLNPPGSYYLICTSGPRLELERLKWVIPGYDLEYSDLGEFRVFLR